MNILKLNTHGKQCSDNLLFFTPSVNEPVIQTVIIYDQCLFIKQQVYDVLADPYVPFSFCFDFNGDNLKIKMLLLFAVTYYVNNIKIGFKLNISKITHKNMLPWLATSPPPTTQLLQLSLSNHQIKGFSPTNAVAPKKNCILQFSVANGKTVHATVSLHCAISFTAKVLDVIKILKVCLKFKFDGIYYCRVCNDNCSHLVLLLSFCKKNELLLAYQLVLPQTTIDGDMT